MRIALLTDGITPYVTGGMQRHSFNLCRSLSAMGVHVDLYHCDPHRRGAHSLDCFTEEERKNISAEVIEFPNLGKIPGHYIKESYAYSRSIANAVRKKPAVDFIYAKGFTGWELLNLKSKGAKLPPIGVNLHGYEMFQVQPDFRQRISAKLLLRAPAKFNTQNADYVFSYGSKITEIIAKLNIPRERIVEIPAAIGTEWLVKNISEVHSPVQFLFVGRDERRKGLIELAEAIRKLPRETRKKASFSFMGPIANKNKVSGCEYYGEVREVNEIRKIYSSCDVLLLPSYSEGMPNVVLEAMGSGLAVAATNVGAVGLMVNNDNGWIIEQPSVSAITEAIDRIVNTDKAELMKRKLSSLHKASSEFTWDVIGKQTFEAIQRCIQRRQNS